MSIRANELNSLALAYIGDAVYELYVRNYLIQSGEVKPNQLHHAAVHYVSGAGQSQIIHDWLAKDILSAEEAAVVRRGRNAKSHTVPKNLSVANYRYATAFESLIGYHYLDNNQERLNELLVQAIDFINQSRDD